MIAQAIQSPESDGKALLTEAAQIIGFRVRTERGEVSFAPAAADANYLDITDAEIRDYVGLFRSGQGSKLANMTDAIDAVLKKVGYVQSCKPDVYQWLQTGSFSENFTTKALTSFIRDLGVHHHNPADTGISDATTLDPIQNLLLLRVVTEEIEMPIRRHRPRTLHAFPATTQSDWNAAPGYAQDLYIAGVTGLEAKIDAFITHEGQVALQSQFAKINPILSLVKVIASYNLLKGEVTMEDPGAPLVRPKTAGIDDYGDKRTIVAHFYYDPNKVTDFLKDYRALLAVTGIDTDMPRGDLSGVETGWEFLVPANATSQTFRAVTGQPDPSRLVTDGNGKAKYTLEGVPQFQPVPEDLAFPVDKTYTINITPQLKRATAGQDVTDIGLAALSALGGDEAMAATSVIIEFMNRAKWSNKTKYSLVVRDWVSAKVVADVSVHIFLTSHSGGDLITKDQSIDVNGVIMTELQKPKPTPTISEAQMALIPADQREKVRQALIQAAGAVAANPYTSFTIDPKYFTVGQSNMVNTRRSFVTTETWSGGGAAKFGTPPRDGSTWGGLIIAIDPVAKQAYIVVSSDGPIRHRIHDNASGNDVDNDDRGGLGKDIPFQLTDPNERVYIPVTVGAADSATAYTGEVSIPIDKDGEKGTIKIKFVLKKRG